MELAMLDVLVAACQEHHITEILGYYITTERNGLVADHYATLGFERIGGGEHKSVWNLKVSRDYAPRNRHIKERVHE